MEARGKDFQLLISPANGSDMDGQTIRVTLNTEKDAVTFRCGSKVRGYADIIVTIKRRCYQRTLFTSNESLGLRFLIPL